LGESRPIDPDIREDHNPDATVQLRSRETLGCLELKEEAQ
jgi:hypothetical protein